MGRDLDELSSDQEAILNAYRAERAGGTTAEMRAGGFSAGGECAFGRVDEIVASDPVNGPHLLVVRQSWSGLPPEPADAAVGPVRCYPVPGRVVSDFSEDDLVHMVYVSGAILVEPLS